VKTDLCRTVSAENPEAVIPEVSHLATVFRPLHGKIGLFRSFPGLTHRGFMLSPSTTASELPATGHKSSVILELFAWSLPIKMLSVLNVPSKGNRLSAENRANRRTDSAFFQH
jgi:hypothetical protein